MTKRSTSSPISPPEQCLFRPHEPDGRPLAAPWLRLACARRRPRNSESESAAAIESILSHASDRELLAWFMLHAFAWFFPDQPHGACCLEAYARPASRIRASSRVARVGKRVCSIKTLEAHAHELFPAMEPSGCSRHDRTATGRGRFRRLESTIEMRVALMAPPATVQRSPSIGFFGPGSISEYRFEARTHASPPSQSKRSQGPDRKKLSSNISLPRDRP
jgi:hypothetical protein